MLFIKYEVLLEFPKQYMSYINQKRKALDPRKGFKQITIPFHSSNIILYFLIASLHSRRIRILNLIIQTSGSLSNKTYFFFRVKKIFFNLLIRARIWFEIFVKILDSLDFKNEIKHRTHSTNEATKEIQFQIQLS